MVAVVLDMAGYMRKSMVRRPSIDRDSLGAEAPGGSSIELMAPNDISNIMDDHDDHVMDIDATLEEDDIDIADGLGEAPAASLSDDDLLVLLLSDEPDHLDCVHYESQLVSSDDEENQNDEVDEDDDNNLNDILGEDGDNSKSVGDLDRKPSPLPSPGPVSSDTSETEEDDDDDGDEPVRPGAFPVRGKPVASKSDGLAYRKRDGPITQSSCRALDCEVKSLASPKIKHKKRSLSLAPVNTPDPDLVRLPSHDEAGESSESIEEAQQQDHDEEDQQQPPLPGAYLVQAGGIVSRTSTVLGAARYLRSQGNNADSFLDSDADTAAFNFSDADADVDSVGSSQLLVAAEVTAETEAEIERTVRKRLLEESMHASVVAIEEVVFNHLPETPRKASMIYKHKTLQEMLFGDKRRPVNISASSDQCIRKREHLLWAVKRNSTTNQWVAAVQTNPKPGALGDIERSIERFVADSEEEAHAIALSMATPKMQRFEDNPTCFLCQSKFAVFRRPSHCRNCGVCICKSGCATNWPAKMIPATYQFKRKDATSANVCLACDWLAREFQQALLAGDYTKALNLYKTGNVNLRTPYYLDKQRGTEILYPIHMAIIGGNLDLVRWLATDRHCPLHIMTRRKGKRLLLTSKGRSPLRLALEHIDILQYLVIEKKLSIFEEENELDYVKIVTHFQSLLRRVSPESLKRLASGEEIEDEGGMMFDNCATLDATCESVTPGSVAAGPITPEKISRPRSRRERSKRLVQVSEDGERRGSF